MKPRPAAAPNVAAAGRGFLYSGIGGECANPTGGWYLLTYLLYILRRIARIFMQFRLTTHHSQTIHFNSGEALTLTMSGNRVGV